ncbi:MAG: preprotein translocase subunit SecG [Mariprofundaceae bacterium]|nr:preprotein translocase subunit SecG [Mariprofundaceae bacterium]
MTTIIIVVHVLIALLLVGVVLIQRGQGADMGVSFGGGGAQTLFGSRGSGSFLGKLTGALAAAFMITSLTLAFFSQQQTGSVVEKAVSEQAPPVQQQPLPESAPAGGFDPSRLKGNTADDGLPAAE